MATLQQQKRLWLGCAVGFMSLALLAVVLSLVKGNANTGNAPPASHVSPSAQTPASNPGPVSSTPVHPSPTAIRTPQPQLNPVPTPEETFPPPSVVQIGNSSWRVQFSVRDRWFATGLPIIANSTAVIENLAFDSTPRGSFIARVGPNDWNHFSPTDGPYLHIWEREDEGASPDLRGTLLLKVNPESSVKLMTVNVTLDPNSVGEIWQLQDDPMHQRIHQQSRQWWDDMLKNLQRN